MHFRTGKVVTCCLAFVGQNGATRSSRLADARHVFMGVHLNFSKVVPAIDANPEHRVLNLYTRALLLLPRPPCWNKHGATRTTRRACHVVTWCNKWNLGLSRMHSARAACTTLYTCMTDFVYSLNRSPVMHLLQLCSSEQSEQSQYPSHRKCADLHWPDPHRNWSNAHADARTHTHRRKQR